MTNTIGGDDRRLFALDDGFFPVPLATTEANRQTKPPAPVDADVAIDRSIVNVVAVQDVSPGVGTDASTYGTFAIDQPVAGIAFGGFLPPGAMCLLAPIERRSALVALCAKDNINVDLADLCTSGPSPAPTGGGYNFPPGSILLRPGEAISFGRLIPGLCGIFFNAWDRGNASTLLPGVNPATYPSATASSYVNERGVYGPTFRPYLRLFMEPRAAPRAIAYTKVPYQYGVQVPTAVGANTFNACTGSFSAPPVNGTCWLPPGTRWVTLNIAATQGANTVPGTSIQLLNNLANSGVISGPFDVGVYWVLGSGLMAQSPRDQWNASGLGQASTVHNVEVYEVPRNAVACCVAAPSPTIIGGASYVPWATFICSED